ncbi:hypothetical protein [Globicatella sp. PHS-GS-PNBC-21-1553]|uniref:helix-turn-helix transcriptional regulator n=1 Tax=Globicatella sp. PHS-GS-PNBC-21-1553 TaxID=2885764 RepID=UPI00298F2A48|nr:hypothetical protein [Globicatella sp. PHS-GS-PNBC-21-1553]WPC08809.1 hypothetical protein LB888_00695 [Globicatella sp. PHS-GS-PNBC-21-1553]
MSVVSRLRKYKGMTQTDMANHLGISLQAYWKKEKGLTPFSDREKVVVRNFFNDEFPGITIDDIFFNDKVPKVEYINSD